MGALGKRGPRGALLPSTETDAQRGTCGAGIHVHIHDTLNGADIHQGQGVILDQSVHELLR